MNEDHVTKAEELSKKALEQSLDCNDSGDMLEPSDRVKRLPDEVEQLKAEKEEDNGETQKEEY